MHAAATPYRERSHFDGQDVLESGLARPGAVGTGWLNRVLKRILAGQGRSEDLNMLVDVANKIEGHTICALGDAAAWPIQSFIKHFRQEFQYMVDQGGRSIVNAAAAQAA